MTENASKYRSLRFQSFNKNVKVRSLKTFEETNFKIWVFLFHEKYPELSAGLIVFLCSSTIKCAGRTL